LGAELSCDVRRPGPSAVWLARLFLLLLAVIVGLPPVQSLTGLFSTIRVEENRTPAKAPDFSLLTGPAAAKFAEQAEAWFDDRIGFRDLLIRTKNQLDVTLFQVHRKLYLGRDHWLFQRTLTDNRLNFERASESTYQDVEKSFSALAQTLRNRGIRLVLVDYPDKSESYPEYLPRDAPAPPPDGHRERLRLALAANPDIIYIDVAALLRPLKRDGLPLFYKTDIHLNVTGSIPVVKEIVRRIAQAEGRDMAWHESFHLEEHNWWGSEALFMSILHPVVEPAISAPDFYVIGQPADDGHWVTADPRKIAYPGWGEFPIFDWEFISTPESCATRLPAAALFGNSFSDLYWSLGLQRYFCRLRRARTPPGAYIDDLPAETKYFILQYFSVFLPGDAPTPEHSGASALPGGVIQSR
jgi:SGNH hydrolase-like domain, acetyltransferase AlgX